MTSGYQEIKTNVPPVLALENGRLVIKLIAGDLTIAADVGNGQYFFSQIVEKLIDPALKLTEQRRRQGTEDLFDNPGDG